MMYSGYTCKPKWMRWLSGGCSGGLLGWLSGADCGFPLHSKSLCEGIPPLTPHLQQGEAVRMSHQ